MTKEKEFISMRRKSFHCINHSITTSAKDMVTMASREKMAIVKTEQMCLKEIVVISIADSIFTKSILF